MSIVNFSIPKTLEQIISQTIKEKGLASKAEFFRFAAVNYLDEACKLPLNDNFKIGWLSSALDEALYKKFKNRRLPSVKKQLAKLDRI